MGWSTCLQNRPIKLGNIGRLKSLVLRLGKNDKSLNERINFSNEKRWLSDKTKVGKIFEIMSCTKRFISNHWVVMIFLKRLILQFVVIMLKAKNFLISTAWFLICREKLQNEFISLFIFFAQKKTNGWSPGWISWTTLEDEALWFSVASTVL